MFDKILTVFDKNGLYDIPKKDFKTKENGHNETMTLKRLNLYRKKFYVKSYIFSKINP